METLSWKNSDIRSWLNGYGPTENYWARDFTSHSFIASAFTNEEKSRIPRITIETARNPEYGTYGDINTSDWIFLLSIEEVKTLLGTGDNMCNKIHCTGYWKLRDRPYFNVSKAGYINATSLYYGPSYIANIAESALVYGLYYGTGEYGIHGIRPALWLYY